MSVGWRLLSHGHPWAARNVKDAVVYLSVIARNTPTATTTSPMAASLGGLPLEMMTHYSRRKRRVKEWTGRNGENIHKNMRILTFDV